MDCRKTGIQLHTLGHAWMFEAFGIHHTDPAREKSELEHLPTEAKRHLALLGGKRGIVKNSSFFTHFCYSNPDTRRGLVNYLVNYSIENPEVNFVHIWLADSTNNQCDATSVEPPPPTGTSRCRTSLTQGT